MDLNHGSTGYEPVGISGRPAVAGRFPDYPTPLRVARGGRPVYYHTGERPPHRRAVGRTAANPSNWIGQGPLVNFTETEVAAPATVTVPDDGVPMYCQGTTECAYAPFGPWNTMELEVALVVRTDRVTPLSVTDQTWPFGSPVSLKVTV